MSKEIEHKDRVGRDLKIGDCVAYPAYNSLGIGTVTKFNPKMLKVKSVGSRSESNKYPSDVVLLEGSDVTMYLLKNQK